MLALETLTFGFAWWLGLCLLARDPAKATARLAGSGLLAYALALASGALAGGAPPEAAAGLSRLAGWLTLLPALCWSAALIHLLPEEAPPGPRPRRWWLPALLVAALALALLDLLGLEFAGIAAGLLALGALALAFALLARSWRGLRPAPAGGLALAATLMFALGSGLLLLPLGWLPRAWLLLAIGADLLIFGLAVALLDAFDAGERLLPAMGRSFIAALGVGLLFGGLAALAMAASGGPTPPLTALLLATVAAAVMLVVLADLLGAALDALVFARFPRVRAEREASRISASAAPRLDAGLDLAGLDEAEFARLTRRALSCYGDLARLAANPLTRLPSIDARLRERGAADNALERAAELKLLLAESVARLKPRAGGDFGATDEWRYYNALYFPYVAGLRPYSLRGAPEALDPASRAALAWFRESIPERTLHNWQTAAARLVSRDLRERAGLAADAAPLARI